MFPGDDGGEPSPRDRMLFHVLRQQADAVRFLAEINRELLQNALNARRRDGHEEPPAEVPKPRRKHVPQNKKHRDWAGFRADLQHFEAIVRRDNQLGPDDEVDKEMIYAAGGPHPRTVARTMVETYHLALDYWPPSIWPATLADKF
jgi:hypothetical protein